MLLEEEFGEGLEAGFGEGGDEGGDGLVVAGLFFGEGGVSGEEGGLFLGGGLAGGPVLGVDAVLVLDPVAGELEGVAGLEGGEEVELGVVGPGLEGEGSGGVGEDEFVVGLAGAGGFFVAGPGAGR